MRSIGAITISAVAALAALSFGALAEAKKASEDKKASDDKKAFKDKPASKSDKAKPDLTVTLVGLPKSLERGASLGRAFVITRNIGKGTSYAKRYAFLVDVVLSSDPKVPKGLATYRRQYREDVLLRGGRHGTIVDVKPGVEMYFPLSASVIPKDTPPGKYKVCAQVDPQRKVDEADERNNVACRTIGVKKEKKK